LIGELSRQANVVPLAYHVDYWDRLGWRDPFSSRSWTARQMAYSRVFHLESAYTPQAVVNGSTQLIGNNAQGLQTLIRNAPPSEATVDLRTAPGGRVHVTASSTHPQTELVVLLVEDGIVTKIERGENAGRTLRNDFVVRKLQRVGKLPFDGDVVLEADPAWKNVHVVALAQDQASLKIYGAAAVAVTPPVSSRP
jgi:hypothetical protein